VGSNPTASALTSGNVPLGSAPAFSHGSVAGAWRCLDLDRASLRVSLTLGIVDGKGRP